MNILQKASGLTIMALAILVMPSLAAQASPSTPLNLTATSTSPTSITLNWASSTDTATTAGYSIFRNNSTTSIATTTSSVLTYTDSGLTPSTTYAYQIAALDATGTLSALSSTTYATTLASTTATTTATTTTISPTIRIVGNENNNRLINLRSNAKIKVIVMASSTFDPKDIVLSTVTFGGAKAETNYRSDVNRDRKTDRVFEFRAKKMTDLINKNATGTVQITFKALTTSGQQITYTANVQVKNFKAWKQDRLQERRLEAEKKAQEIKKQTLKKDQEAAKAQLQKIKANSKETKKATKGGRK